MVEATLFISLVIVAAVQLIKMAAPTVVSWLTIIVALVIGIIIALVDSYIGVTDISVAQGIVAAFGAIGLSTLANKAAGS